MFKLLGETEKKNNALNVSTMVVILYLVNNVSFCVTSFLLFSSSFYVDVSVCVIVIGYWLLCIIMLIDSLAPVLYSHP